MDMGWKKVATGKYLSSKVIWNSPNGVPYCKYSIVKREDGTWQCFELIGILPNGQGNYIPYISNLQTNEVIPNTGKYRTLADAKTAFNRPMLR